MSLQAIKAAGPNPFYMTPAEGQDLASRGLIAVHEANPMNPNQFRVTLTPAGEAEFLKTQGSTAVKSKPTFEIESGFPIPTVKRGGFPEGMQRNRESSYPFDKMEIGQSFHVAVTADEQEPWKKLASSVNAANKRNEIQYIDPSNGQPVPEIKTVKKLQKDASGKVVLDANGKKVSVATQEQGFKMVPTKKFRAFKVGDTDPKGPGCRVFRVPLN